MRAAAALLALVVLTSCTDGSGPGPEPPGPRFTKVLPSLPPSRGTRAFDDPAALAFAPNGDLWVANRESSTLARYAPGQLAPGLRAPVPANVVQGGAIKGPNAMVLDAHGYLWVAMRDAHRVAGFTPEDLAAARPPSLVLPDPTGVLREPAGVALDADGNLWVANAGVGRLARYPRRGGLEAGTALPDVVLTVADDDCGSIGVHLGRLWLGCAYSDAFYVYDAKARTGRPPWLTRLDHSGCGPVQIVAAPAGGLAAACSRAPSVMLFARDGVPGVDGRVTTQALTAVHGIAYDSSGALWAGTSRNVIARFTDTGPDPDDVPDVVLRPRREDVPTYSSAPVGYA